MPRPTGKKSSDDEPEDHLTGTAPRKATTRPPTEHPQLRHLAQKANQLTANLQVWFDAGLVRANTDCFPFLTGSKPLPIGYEGCNKDSVLITVEGSGVQMWPARVDLGELDFDTAKPLTLYHYTHQRGFDSFVRLFQNIHAGDATKSEVSKELLTMLQADYLDRVPISNNGNRKGEPELLLVEPGNLKSKKETLKWLYDGHVPSGTSSSGMPFDFFADFCLPFCLPGNACTTVRGQFPNVSFIRISLSALEALARRVGQHREQAKKELQMLKKSEQVQAASAGCFGFLCSRGASKLPESWDHTDGKIDEAEDTLQRMGRSRRVEDPRIKQLNQKWLQEHFHYIQRKKEMDEKLAAEQASWEKAEQARKEAEKQHSTAAKARFQSTPTGASSFGGLGILQKALGLNATHNLRGQEHHQAEHRRLQDYTQREQAIDGMIGQAPLASIKFRRVETSNLTAKRFVGASRHSLGESYKQSDSPSRAGSPSGASDMLILASPESPEASAAESPLKKPNCKKKARAKVKAKAKANAKGEGKGRIRNRRPRGQGKMRSKPSSPSAPSSQNKELAEGDDSPAESLSSSSESVSASSSSSSDAESAADEDDADVKDSVSPAAAASASASVSASASASVPESSMSSSSQKSLALKLVAPGGTASSL